MAGAMRPVRNFPKLSLLLFFVIPVISWAQAPTTPLINSTLQGRVTDAGTKEPLAGATVQIEGVTHSVKTDAKGSFNFVTGQRFPYTLLVSFVGYKTNRIVVETSPAEIELQPEVSNLEDVVVIGYGVAKRKDLTGSVASVPAALRSQPVSSPDKLLQGAVPGVQVTQSGGQPGSSVSIRVRGGTSINAGNEPLYVIDGFPVYNGDESVDAGVASGEKINPLSNINPSDIESIEVLKDASATAIYGSRGANGVVLITTRRAKNNQSSVNYDAYYGVQSVIRKLPLLNAEEWGALKNDARADAGKTPLYSAEELKALGKGTDWQEEAFRTAPITSHNLSVSTGSENSRLLISGNYFKQDGVIINTGFERYSGRINVEHDFNDKFKVGAFLTGSATDAKLAPGGVVEGLLEMPPTIAVRDAEGNFVLVSNFETAIGNPINTLYNQTNQSKTRRFLLNGFGEYRIIKGLTAKVLIGTDIINNKQNRYLPSTVFEGLPAGKASIGSLGTTNWLNENTLTYKGNIGSDHAFDIVVGNTQQQSITEVFSAGSSNFVNDAFTYNNLGAGTVLLAPGSLYSKWTLKSYLGRVNYGFRDKYLFTVTVRSDGSSRFGNNNKWGTFPSAAFAWNAGDEKFIAAVKPISSLKLRISAGLTGNQEISTYRSLARLSYYRYNFEDRLVGGFAPSSYENPNLSWEKTAQYNLGIDLGLFANRISLTTDIYYKKTNDLLLEVPLPFSSGIESAFQNYGSIENKGIELALRTENFTGKFKWTTHFIFSANRNKVLSLGPGVTEFIPINPSNTVRTSEIVRVGEPLGNFFMYVTDGLFQEGDDFSLSPTQNTRAGSQKYKDINGDGQITQAGDVTIVGNSQPKFLGGFSNNFKYENFDLNIFFQSSYGNKIFNNTRALLEIGSGFTGTSAVLKNRWTPANTNTDVHRAIEDPSPTLSDRFVEDGSYLRLKNITLGYTLPLAVARSIKLKNLRIYVSAQNLITWTNYTGFDPEVSRNGQLALSSGFDFGGYPGTKTITGGLSVTF